MKMKLNRVTHNTGWPKGVSHYLDIKKSY